MVDTITWNAIWQDPGATAIDAVDGNVTSRVQSLGVGERARSLGLGVGDLLMACSSPRTWTGNQLAILKHHPIAAPPLAAAAVKTSIPTSPDRQFGFVVEYNVDDLSGNSAPTARRLIRVACPPPEQYCTDPDTAQGTCTVGGVCGRPAALLALAAPTAAPAAGPGGAVAPVPAGAAAAVAAAAASAAAASKPAPTPPNITLLGAPLIEIVAGAVFDRCPSGATLGALCDRGAAATDALDGPLDQTLAVCGSPLRTRAGVRPVPVLLACGIDGSTPGEYKIVYTATNSAGFSAGVTRRLRIRPKCPAGESLCSDGVTCSDGGTCLARALSQQAAAPAASAGGAAAPAAPKQQAAAAAVAAAAAPPPNVAPNITLVTTDKLGPLVYVRRAFGSYAACDTGKSPTADAPCEPGAIAIDPDGADARSAGGAAVNLTDSVVVCPPDSCLTLGCSPQDLRKHYFSVKVGPFGPA